MMPPMTTLPFNSNDVIVDLSEQIKQLSLNNTILRAMLKASNEAITALQAAETEDDA
jgi:hypothetical protein